MAGNVLDVTDANFEAEVLKSDRPVLVDFWAAWCGPCKLIAPTLEAVASAQAGKLKVVKVNIDDNPDTPARFHIQSIPTLLFFKNGQVAGQRVGNVPKEDILKLVEA